MHGKRSTFHRARRPSDTELNQLLDTLSRRIVRVLERQGLLVADPEYPHLEFEPGSSLEHLHAATLCEVHQRSRPECPCRYITRPPIATQRLSLDHQGRVIYQYKMDVRVPRWRGRASKAVGSRS